MASTFATDARYAELTAAEVVAALPGLDTDELVGVEQRERSGKSRVTVLRGIAALRAAHTAQTAPGSITQTAEPRRVDDAAPVPDVPPSGMFRSPDEETPAVEALRPGLGYTEATDDSQQPLPPRPRPKATADADKRRGSALPRIGFGVVAILAVVGAFVVPTFRADTSGYKAAARAAISDYDSNDAKTTGAPQQAVVNGWIARDLLEIQTAQHNDELTLLSVIASLLVLLTIAVCGVGAVVRTDAQKRQVAESSPGGRPSGGLRTEGL